MRHWSSAVASPIELARYECCSTPSACPRCRRRASSWVAVQVPMDQGENSLDMLEHLTRDKPFECAKPRAAVASSRLQGLAALSGSALTADGSS